MFTSPGKRLSYCVIAQQMLGDQNTNVKMLKVHKNSFILENVLILRIS